MEQDRLRWRCRRGLLELDIVLRTFLDRGYDRLPPVEQKAFQELLDTPDTDLWSWLSGGSQPSKKELKEIVKKISQVIDKNNK